MILNDIVEHDRLLDQLEMIDSLQRFGVAYHFDDEINMMLLNIYQNSDNQMRKENLYAAALEFRLLREYGYHSSPGTNDSVIYNEILVGGVFNNWICSTVFRTIEEVSGHLYDDIDPILAFQVRHAMELPLQWRMPRLEARLYVDVYERRSDSNPIVLELAKLDFNVLQALHQEEIKDMSSSETYDILKEKGHDVVSNLKKAWVDLLGSYMLEARRYLSGYTPTSEEYMENAGISITLIATQANLFVTNKINEKELEFLESYPELLYWSSVVFRLQDDLGTSPDELKRGDVSKSIQCYMHGNVVPEEATREHIKNLMRETWKKVNIHRATVSPLSQSVNGIKLNLVRAHCIYQHGDGHGSQNH
ncbi:(R)-limonene synthase 1 [Hibiscus syriacus]|uniref:(R)-limonene synthase 1 n=1 Tax=Hibiscus syriacus TaxID=106335 RepID=A0A6A2YGR9_HIBSY|nr:(R)-limonene synthase 1 [Hibiscus syriacus]